MFDDARRPCAQHEAAPFVRCHMLKRYAKESGDARADAKDMRFMRGTFFYYIARVNDGMFFQRA